MRADPDSQDYYDALEADKVSDLIDGLRERQTNSENFAVHAKGIEDRDGWLEDSEFYKSVLERIALLEAENAELRKSFNVSEFQRLSMERNRWKQRAETAEAKIKDLLQTCLLAEENAVKLEATLAEREREIEQLKKPHWKCFFCEFETSDRETAEDHFGDRDDAEEFKPICKWWDRMDGDERKQTLQDYVHDLKIEQECNESLRSRLATAREALILAKKEMIASGNWDARDYGWPKASEAIDAALAATDDKESK